MYDVLGHHSAWVTVVPRKQHKCFVKHPMYILYFVVKLHFPCPVSYTCTNNCPLFQQLQNQNQFVYTSQDHHSLEKVLVRRGYRLRTWFSPYHLRYFLVQPQEKGKASAGDHDATQFTLLKSRWWVANIHCRSIQDGNFREKSKLTAYSLKTFMF